MGKWRRSLPRANSVYTDRAANALSFIGMAMRGAEFPAIARAHNARKAAAEIRAWRKSLAEDTPKLCFTPTDVRYHLRRAARRVLDADDPAQGAGQAMALRAAETHLREAARLLDAEAR